MTEFIAEVAGALAAVGATAAIAWFIKRSRGEPIRLIVGDHETIVTDSDGAHLLTQSNIITTSGDGRRRKVIAVGAPGEFGSLGLPLSPGERKYDLAALSKQDPKLAIQLWQAFSRYLLARAVQTRSSASIVSAWRLALSKGVVSIEVSDSTVRSVIRSALSQDRGFSFSQP